MFASVGLQRTSARTPCSHRAATTCTLHRYDYFNPSAIHAGGQNITVATPLQYFPVFAKTGAILPLNVTNNEAGHGAGINGGGLTFLVHTPSLDAAGVTQTVSEYQSTGVEAGCVAAAGTRVRLCASARLAAPLTTANMLGPTWGCAAPGPGML